MGYIGREETQVQRYLFDDEAGGIPEVVPQTKPEKVEQTEPVLTGEQVREAYAWADDFMGDHMKVPS